MSTMQFGAPVQDDPTQDAIWKRWLTELQRRNTSASAGTVTSVAQSVPAEFSVAGSPITTSGTLAITKATQTANQVWASATSGGAAQPAFRSLVTADLPAGTGTVTSVAQTFTGGLISVSGSPITASGTLALTVAGTSGGIPYFSGATTWASSGALTASALILGGGAGAAPTPMGSLGTTTTVLHGNPAGAPTFGAVSLTADVSGILPLTNLPAWMPNKFSTDASETLTIAAGYSLVVEGPFTNNGDIVNNGRMMVH